ALPQPEIGDPVYAIRNTGTLGGWAITLESDTYVGTWGGSDGISSPQFATFVCAGSAHIDLVGGGGYQVVAATPADGKSIRSASVPPGFAGPQSISGVFMQTESPDASKTPADPPVVYDSAGGY